MNGKIIYEVHKCIPPVAERHLDVGSVWQCECNQRWELVYDLYSYHTATTPVTKWVILKFLDWNEEENRPLTKTERAWRDTMPKDWREKVKDMPYQDFCPTCEEKGAFGQIWYPDVEGFRQDCVKCRVVHTPSIWERFIAFIKGEK